MRSLSGPVDVITPFDDVVATTDGESDPADPLFVELQTPPMADVGEGDARELPLLELVLFREARLLALALMRRFKSSLRSDLRGETCTGRR